MIKGGGLSTLFSRVFTSLLVVGSTLLLGSFVNAHVVTIGDLTYTESPFDSQYENSVLKRGKFLGKYLGYTKPLFAMDSDSLLFWTTDGHLYLYDLVKSSYAGCSDRIFQGEIGKFSSCDVITGTIPENCSSSLIDYDSNIIGYFLQSVGPNDIFYYDHSYNTNVNCAIWDYSSNFCFSSESLGKSLCFLVTRNYNNSWNNNILDYPKFDTTNFASIPTSILGDPPLYSNIDGGSSTVNNAMLTGDVMQRECTKQTALEWYQFNGYSKRLCYGGLDNFSTTTGVLPVAGQGLDVEEIWFNTNTYRRNGATGTALDYQEWFHYWRGIYESYKKNTDLGNPFIGLPTVLFTYFGMVDAYGLAYTDSSILNYCDLAIYTNDYNVIYSGLNSDTICSSSLISFVDQSVASQLGTGPVVGSSWEGITDRPQYQGDSVPGWGTGAGTSSSTVDNSVSQDGVTFQNGFFNLLKNSFKYPTSGGSGALPSYILLALVGLIFFRFLMH